MKDLTLCRQGLTGRTITFQSVFRTFISLGLTFNKHYNPAGKLDAKSFQFPYDSSSFDFVFLKSVFTHMRPDSVQHYLREIRRVLKLDGRCLATAFLLNSEATELIHSGRSSLPLTHDFGGF